MNSVITIVPIQGRPPGMPIPKRTYVEESAPQLALTKTQAAQTLRVSEKTIERLVARGLLRASRALRTPRFTLKSIEDYLERTSKMPEVAR